MKKLLKLADRYLAESDWKTISILKFCLFSMGLLCGMSVREKDKTPARIAAGTVFLACYIPLMAKLFHVIGEECEECRGKRAVQPNEEPEQSADEPSEPEQTEE